MDSIAVGIDVRRFAVKGGQDRYLWRLGGWLAGAGHRVEILSVREQPADIDPPGGARLHRLHDLSRTDLGRHVRALELDALLLNPERARRYRGVHANVLRPGYGTEHYRQKLRSFRTPWGQAGRRLLRLAPWVQMARRWERRFYEGTDPPPEVIANSWYMRSEVLSSYRVPESHVHVVHNGIDLEEFSPTERQRRRAEQRAEWGIPQDAVCILFMGNNYRLKGLWQLLRVLPRLRRESGAPDLRLLVAGSGVGSGQPRKARRLIQQADVADAVHLLGRVHPAIRAFAAADLFVHLSWHDAFAFVVLEAMACGLPVVTTRYVGAAELIEDGASGLIVDPADPDALADRIRRLLDGAESRRIGDAAARVGAEHSEPRNFQDVLRVMEAARSRAGGPVG